MKTVRAFGLLPWLLVGACSSEATHAHGPASSAGQTGAGGVPNGMSGSGSTPAGAGGSVSSAGSGASTPLGGAAGANAGTGPSAGTAAGGHDAHGDNPAGGSGDASAGSPGLGGVSALGGTAGMAGIAGVAGGAGKGVGTPDICSFQIDVTPSATIPTVGIVNWMTDLAGLSDASVEFSLDDPAPGTLNTGSGGPIDVSGTTHRALLLGLKAEHTYTYRLIAKNGSATCTSADQSFTTGAATTAPNVVRTVMNADAQAPGFILTSGGYRGGSRGWPMAYIIDADGDVVWWADSPADCTRALLDWEGQNVWMVDLNPSPVAEGTVHRIAMDGSGAEDVDGFDYAHHDLAVVPGGIVAFLVWGGDGNTASDLVERSPDGTLKTIVTLDEHIFGTTPTDGFHANSIMYHPTDDTYTVSDLYTQSYVKLSRQGELLWQFGTDCTTTKAPKCAPVMFGGNHGHHLLDDGHFVFFLADFDMSPVYDYTLTETSTSLSVNQVWSYMVDGMASDVLGDVQRLPNGNTLVDYCRDGHMQEVSPAGDVVQQLDATCPPADLPTGNYPPLDSLVFTFGYMNFRETLYGAPLR